MSVPNAQAPSSVRIEAVPIKDSSFNPNEMDELFFNHLLITLCATRVGRVANSAWVQVHVETILFEPEVHQLVIGSPDAFYTLVLRQSEEAENGRLHHFLVFDYTCGAGMWHIREERYVVSDPHRELDPEKVSYLDLFQLEIGRIVAQSARSEQSH